MPGAETEWEDGPSPNVSYLGTTITVSRLKQKGYNTLRLLDSKPKFVN